MRARLVALLVVALLAAGLVAILQPSHSAAAPVLCPDVSVKGIKSPISLNKTYHGEIDLKRSTYTAQPSSVAWRWVNKSGWMSTTFEQSGSTFKYKFGYGRTTTPSLQLQIYVQAAIGLALTDCSYVVTYNISGK